MCFFEPDWITCMFSRDSVSVCLCVCLPRECLRSVIMLSEEPEVSCPYRDDTYSCDRSLQEREIRAVSHTSKYSTCSDASVWYVDKWITFSWISQHEATFVQDYSLSVKGVNKSATISLSISCTVGASRRVWALAAKRPVSGRVSMWGQLPLCHTRLSGLVRVRGHGQCLPLPRLQETQLPDLQGMMFV